MLIMSEADGAKSPIYVATAKELEGVSGRYFDRLREVAPSKVAQDEDAARRLWDVSQRLVDSALNQPDDARS
jgi:hypothetical protein